MVNGQPVPQEWLAEIPSGRYTVKMGGELLQGLMGTSCRQTTDEGRVIFLWLSNPGTIL